VNKIVVADKTISSIPDAIQTKESTVDPTEFEIPKELSEAPTPKPPVVFRHPKPKKAKSKRKPKPKTVRKPKPTALPQETVSQQPTAPVPPEPKPKKRRSAMDILNGRGL
jgi:hypothetical protein